MAKKQQKPTAASKPNILARLGPKGGQASDGRPVKSSQRSGYGFGGAGSGSTSSLAAGRIITVGGSGHPATTGYSTYAGHNAPKPKTLNDRFRILQQQAPARPASQQQQHQQQQQKPSILSRLTVRNQPIAQKQRASGPSNIAKHAAKQVVQQQQQKAQKQVAKGKAPATKGSGKGKAAATVAAKAKKAAKKAAPETIEDLDKDLDAYMLSKNAKKAAASEDVEMGED